MPRSNGLRMRVDEQGRLEVVDAGLDCLDLLRATDGTFRVRQAPLPGFVTPRFVLLRGAGAGIRRDLVKRASEASLWKSHELAMREWRSGTAQPVNGGDEISILELKATIASRLLSSCVLCAQRCGVDRTKRGLGVCRLGAQAIVAEHFVHIGEEAPFNPSLVVSLGGCGLRCRYCQQWPLLDPTRLSGIPLDGSFWKALDLREARSLSFAGGNPDESLPAVLRFLSHAPAGWRLPIVWNSHGYGSAETLLLLDGVVDAYVPDFKYGSNGCGRRWSGASKYPDVARETVAGMLAQGVPVFVRLLVLPGHGTCCHLPAVDALANLKPRDNIWVSVRGQYCPDGKIGDTDGAMGGRPARDEVETVRAAVLRAGLRRIE